MRAKSSEELHAILGALALRRPRPQGLSDAQEWFWDACVSELEYRRRTAPRGSRRCSCYLCLDPEYLASVAGDDG